jgi:uncharacterized protein with HEPN domain
MRNDIRDFLTDIVDYCTNAKTLVQSNEMKDLAEKFSPQGLALERTMEIIGEAVKKIPPEIREQYPEIPWRQVAGLRDILAHQYWAAQMGRLVDVVENHIPALEETAKKILKDLNTTQ